MLAVTAATAAFTVTSSATNPGTIKQRSVGVHTHMAFKPTSEMNANHHMALFYTDEPLTDEADVTCWMDPENPSKFVCARDVDLRAADHSADDSY